MNCIIIDDEPKAIEVLETFIRKTPFLNHLGSFRDPVLAMNFIIESKPDLMFLDINMPDITGIQLLKSLTIHPIVVFTTAYTEFAVESYDLNALDYLLKPIEFERFLKAAIKAKELLDTKKKEKNIVSSNEPEDDALFIKSGPKTYRIEFSDILFVEGMGNYVNFVTADKKITSYLNMQETLQLLPTNGFCRIHKSYIISLKHIDTIEIHQVKIGSHSIPIGKSYRDEFFKVLKR